MATGTTNPDQAHRGRTVLVTGANGYIGSAVSRAFVRAGWKTFGLIRRPEAAKALITSEVIPVIGSFTDLSFLDGLYEQASTFDAIVSCTEQLPGYAAHFAQVISLVKAVAEKSNQNGVRPLVLWSSGCKDYGTTGLHGSPGLAPHTEESPLRPVDILKERAESCLKIMDFKELFDAAAIRPTCVVGYSSSYYGPMLNWVEAEKARGRSVLRVPADANSIMHAAHIDDCAEAYVALAEHEDRSAVANQCFNISGYRYETAGEMGAALAKEYGFEGGVEFVPQEEADAAFPVGLHFAFSYSQWVGSDKIRRITGWSDKRLLFSQNLHVYRLAYEAFRASGHDNVAAAQQRLGGNFMTNVEW